MTRLPGRRTESQATSPATKVFGRPETTPRLVTTELRTTTGAFKSLRKPNRPAQLEAGAAAVNSNARIPTCQTFTKRHMIGFTSSRVALARNTAPRRTQIFVNQ